jgi:hypothetical protein
MDNTIKKVFYVVSIILIVLATAYQIAVLYQGDKNVSDGVLNGFFYVAYASFIISVVLALIFPVLQLASDPKGAIKTVIIIGGAIVLWFIVRAFSSNTFTPEELEKMETTANTAALVGAGLVYTYIVFGIALLLIIYSNITKLLK